MTDDMQRARELLAAEYKAEDYAPMTHEAKRFLRQAHLGRRESAAVRAITAALRAAPAGLDRARETPRRQRAVELLLSMGYNWNDGAWQTSTPAAPGVDLGVRGATLTIDGKTFTVDEVRAALIDASPKGGSSVRAQFEAWLAPSWSQEGDTDEDGDFVYREDWVQGAWIGYQAAMQATSAATERL